MCVCVRERLLTMDWILGSRKTKQEDAEQVGKEEDEESAVAATSATENRDVMGAPEVVI